MTESGRRRPGGTEPRPDRDSTGDIGPHHEITAGSRHWLGFSFLCLGLLVMSLDLSVTDVAVPSIVADLGVSADDASLVVTVFMVVAASFMVLMGNLSDRIGGRRAFLIGATVFAVGSLITGAAPSFPVLLLGRSIQGLVVALAIPASLSLLNHQFPGGRARVLAFSIWTAVIGSAMALGPLLGGYLSTYASWRWAFFINVPLMLVSMLGTRATMAEPGRVPDPQGLDVLGSVITVLGIALLVFGLQEATSLGWWHARTDTILGDTIPWPFAISATPVFVTAGVLLLILLIGVERGRTRRGLPVVVDSRLFRVRSFTWGSTAAALMTAGVFGLLLLLPLYDQYVLDGSPLDAGLLLAPLGVGMAVGGPVVSRLRLPQHVIVLAMLAMQPVATAALIPGIGPDGRADWMLVVLVVQGFAWGAAYSILVSLLLADVPKDLSGVAGGTQTALRLTAGAVFGAILTTLLLASVADKMQQVDESGLTAGQRTEIQQLYSFSAQMHPPTTDAGQTIQQRRAESPVAEVYQETKQVMSDGIRTAVGGAALLSLAGLLCGIPLYREKARQARSRAQ